jgi:ubiquinone/menaquinone biosynthesis C-methylase UbiE
VVKGDFMAIDAETSSVDMIYCNAVDHAFDLRKFFAEHARVLKPQGLAIYDVSMAPPGSFEAVDWGEAQTLYRLMLASFADIERVTINGTWKTIRLRGKRPAANDQPPAVATALATDAERTGQLTGGHSSGIVS